MSGSDSTQGDGSDLDRQLKAFVEEAGATAARDVLHQLQSKLGSDVEGLPRAGSMLGEYRLLKQIGRGGMGVIYEAEQSSVPGRRVAVKLLARSAGSAVRLRRFQREIEVIGRLDHRHIVPILSADLSGDVPWYAMKLVSGRTLRELLDEGESFDFGRLAKIFCELASALDHAHGKGVIHRDVNSHNIMVDDQGRALLLDFGLAHDNLAQTALTLGDDALGTAECMAPEQVSGRAGDICPATDVYGLGATLYRCLCGRPPFSGRTLHEVFERILAGHPTPPRKLAPEIPADLAAICLQAMAPGVEARYPSARAMADDLTAFLEYSPVQARSPGPLRRAMGTVRQHRGVSLVTLLALLFATGVWLHANWWTPRRLLDEQQVAARAGDLEQATRLNRRLEEDYFGTGFARESQRILEEQSWLKLDAALDELKATLLRDEIDDESLALAYDELSALGVDHDGLQRARAEHAAVCLVRALEAQSQLFNPAAVSLWSGRLRESAVTAAQRSLLDRDGELRVRSPGGPAQVWLHSPVKVDGRMLFDEDEATAIDLGLTPTSLHRVPEGSYLLIAKRPGWVDTRLPLLVRRSAIQGRREQELSIELLTAEELGEGWRFIPGGYSVLGGGSAESPHELTWVDSFCIMEEEASERWLHDLLWRPGVPWEGQLKELRYILSEGSEQGQTQLKHPGERAVGGVRALDINAVMTSLNGREAELGSEARWLFRLPRPHEWERVGRGADGRLYPWGMSYREGLCSDYHYCADDDQYHDWRASPPGDISPFGVRSLAGGRREICVPDDLLAVYGQGRFVIRGGSIDARVPKGVSLLEEELADAVLRDRTVGFRMVKERLPVLEDAPYELFLEDFDDRSCDGGLPPGWQEHRLYTGAVHPSEARAAQCDGQLQIKGYADDFSKMILVSHPVSVPPGSFRLTVTVMVDSEHPSELTRAALIVGLVERPEWINLNRELALAVNTSGTFELHAVALAPDGPRWDEIAGRRVHIELLVRDGQCSGRLWDDGQPRRALATLGPLPLPHGLTKWRPRAVFLRIGNLDAIRVAVEALTVEPLD